MRITKTFIAILLTLLVSACSANAEPTPVPTPEPGPPVEGLGPDAAVPEATLTNEAGESQVGLPGTRCWGGMCVDMIGIPAPSDPLVVSPDETLTINVTAGQPSSMNLRVLEWQESEFPAEPGDAIIDFEAPVVASGDLDLAQEVEWIPALAPGEYALNLFSAYEGSGDISYGWHIVVEE